MLKRDKRTNISKILHALWIQKVASRVQIARSINLDKSTVTNIVNELIEIDLIQIVAEGDSGPLGGRKPVMLKINPGFGYVLGAELQPGFCRTVLVDLDGTIVEREKYFIDAPGAFEALLNSEIDQFLRRQSDQGRSILGLGVGLPGVVDPFRSVLKQSIPLQVAESFSLPQFSSPGMNADSISGKPVLYENDAKCCAWGELALGRRNGIRNFITVLIELNDSKHPAYDTHSVAVGVGIVIDGRVYYGKNYSSGEFRSLFWNEGSTTQFSFTPDEIERITTDSEVQQRFLNELSLHVAFLVNMFNLSHVFFGGDALVFEKRLPAIINEAINRNWPYTNSVECEISFLSRGGDAVSYGAAGMILNAIFAEDAIVSHEGIVLPTGIDFLY
jgi:predicted NBD/HSP70 family sugar kinase